jgi:hypothetical protein
MRHLEAREIVAGDRGIGCNVERPAYGQWLVLSGEYLSTLERRASGQSLDTPPQLGLEALAPCLRASACWSPTWVRGTDPPGFAPRFYKTGGATAGMGSENLEKAHLSVGLQSSLLTLLLPGVDPGVYARAALTPARAPGFSRDLHPGLAAAVRGGFDRDHCRPEGLVDVVTRVRSPTIRFQLAPNPEHR